MKSIHSLLLASTALFAVATALPPAQAATIDHPLIIAQAPPPAATEPPAREKPQQQPQQRPAQPQAQKPVPPTAPVPPAQSQAPAAAQPKPPERPTAQTPAERQQERRDQRREQQPAAQTPAPKPATPTAQQPPAKPPAPTAQQPGPKPATPGAPQTPAQPPAAQGKPPQAVTPTAQQPAPGANPAAEREPPRPRDASDFIRRDNQKPARGLEDVRRERQETREGNRVSIREGNRTIVRENNRVIIRHNEVDRFTVGARNVQVERRGNQTTTIVERPDGFRIVTITGPDGRLIRRLRRDRQGHDVVIINNVFPGPRVNVFIDVDMGPPVIRIPRDRYILVAARATPALIYDVFMEPPVERLERRYTLEQVRYSAPLRDRMPRVDLDVNFETGSWQLTPEQVGTLSAIAEGLNRAIKANPREVFLIEGHTDATGSPEDNLSLSDRRAEAVAVALTEQFQVPPENLVTQGYGEQNLKVQTQGDEPANRRVSVRRITPLIDQAQK